MISEKFNLSQLMQLERERKFEELANIKGGYRAGSIEIDATEKNINLLFDRLEASKKPPLTSIPSRNHLPDLQSLHSSGSGSSAEKKWAAVITLWKRKSYLQQQYEAIKKQSIPPTDIIIVLNEGHISCDEVRRMAPDARIISSDINSLYTRWFVGYLSSSDYVCVFDDDVIPGSKWMANAIRACDSYNALVGSAGRIYNGNGIHGFFELVIPAGKSEKNKVRDCSITDVFCDWICNTYVFRKEWIGCIFDFERYNNTHKTFDDIQLSATLQIRAGVKCVVPAQPLEDVDLHGSTEKEYGNDEFAVWKTNQFAHFENRKKYVEELIGRGYTPVGVRTNLRRLVLIVPFHDYEFLDKCLLSIKGQKYRNKTVVVIDDSQELVDRSNDIKAYQISNLIYVKTNERMYSLGARLVGMQVCNASLNDVIVHLDGDDWLTDPFALDKIAECYARGDVQATYGNAVSYFPKNPDSFWSFYPFVISEKWNFSSGKKDDSEFPLRRLLNEEIQGDWRKAPWGAMHARTFTYNNWLTMPKDHFWLNGRLLRVATDAAIFLPILNNLAYDQVEFIKEIIYGYRNGNNTIHMKSEVKDDEKANVRRHLSDADFKADSSRLYDYLAASPNQDDWPRLVDVTKYDILVRDTSGMRHSITERFAEAVTDRFSIHGIATVITGNYIGDGFLAVLSTAHYAKYNTKMYIFVSGIDAQQHKDLRNAYGKLGIEILHKESLVLKQYANSLSVKYSENSDEYRWAMKSVLLMEMIHRGCDTASFVDPDLFTVNDVADVFEHISSSDAAVFPHFRDPDDQYLRSVLYRDGFFNGGLIAISKKGLDIAERLYQRCLKEMLKVPEKNRWDDQKYFDLIVLENNNVYVNQDRGIDYNPWNYEPVLGISGPSVRSFMLASGYYVRNWHVSTNMIKQSIEGHPRHTKHKVVVFYYIIALLMSITINVWLLRRAGLGYLFGLDARYAAVRKLYCQISRDKSIMGEFDSLFSYLLKDSPSVDDGFVARGVTKLLATGLFDSVERCIGDIVEIALSNAKVSMKISGESSEVDGHGLVEMLDMLRRAGLEI